MANRRHSQSGLLVVGLLLLSSTLALVQLGIATPSYGQYVTQTTFPPGMSTTWHVHTGSRTWTNVGNRSFTWSGNVTWGHVGNHTWSGHTWTGTPTANQTWSRPGNVTRRGRGEVPGLVNGWAHWNMTVAARNMTQPMIMNGTQRIQLGSIAIRTSSTGQMIRNVAFNGSVFQIEFDRNGSIQLTVNSSVEPSQVYADGNLLSEASSFLGLTPQSEAWVYDPNNQTLFVFADPASVTLIYAPSATVTTTLVPEYPTTLYIVLISCFILTLFTVKTSPVRRRQVSRD